MIEVLKRWLGRVRDRARKAEKTKEPTTTRLEPIELSPSQREQVERKLSELPEDSAPIYERARRAAVRSQALPLFLGDWFGIIALRLDGEVVWVPDEGEPGDIEVIQDERMRNLGLFQGTKCYPDLEFLIPTQPADAIECSYCRGLGNIMFASGPEIVCYCGSLGWLPRNMKF